MRKEVYQSLVQSQTDGTLSMSSLGFFAMTFRAFYQAYLSELFAFLRPDAELFAAYAIAMSGLSTAILAYYSLMTSRTPLTSIRPWRRADPLLNTFLPVCISSYESI